MCKWFVTYLYCLENGIIITIPYTGHTWVTNNPFLIYWNFCQPMTELLKSNWHQLYKNTCFNYIQEAAFQDQCMEHILFSFFQDHFLVQSQGYPLSCKPFAKLHTKTYISRSLYKNRSMGSVLILWHIIIVVNVVFEEVFALERLRHIIRSERTVHIWVSPTI